MLLRQTIEILRPSRIHVSATMEREEINKVLVGGRTISVAKGRLFLP